MKPADHDEKPPFTAPWQAQAFALTVHLNESGLFAWREWGEVFSAQRRRSSEAGIADQPDQYYLDWIAALEALLIRKGSASDAALQTLKQAWIDAYERTPHGNPVHLDPAAGMEPGARC